MPSKKVWELPIPEFNGENKKHLRLEEIARACESKVEPLLLSLSREGAIGRARTAVRQALKDELTEIDSIVKALLK